MHLGWNYLRKNEGEKRKLVRIHHRFAKAHTSQPHYHSIVTCYGILYYEERGRYQCSPKKDWAFMYSNEVHLPQSKDA